MHKKLLFGTLGIITAMLLPHVASAQRLQSCFAPIVAQAITLEAQTEAIVQTVIANDVEALAVVIDWDDNSVLTGGAGEYTHVYLRPGKYEPTISGTGFLGGTPCATPPTVFAVVTVTDCSGANCAPPDVVALTTKQPPGLFRPFPVEAAKGSRHCGHTTKPSDEVEINQLKIFYARDIDRVPDGWPVITFCATHEGLVRLEEILLQGAPGFPHGVVDTITVFVQAGYNAVIPDGPPPPTQTFGYLGPFYLIQTDQTTTGQTLSKRIVWTYAPLGSTPLGILPRVIPLGADVSTTKTK